MKKILNISIIIILIFSIVSLSGCGKKVVEDKNTVEKKSITTENLKRALNDDSYIIVDIRDSAAYNGWKIDGIERGGHIKGSVDFPLVWTKSFKEKEVKAKLEDKGITSDKTVVVYDNNGKSTKEMVEFLNDLGYENVLEYEKGINEWASDSDLPMENLKNYSKLVYPEWVNDLINGNNPETYTNDKYKIFEVSWGEPNDYNKGHITGAYHIDTNAIEEEPLWNRVSDENIEKMLLDHGITYDTTVILYGGDTTAAARAASIMLYAGVEDVRLLDGGYGAWEKSGFEIETEANELEKVEAFGKEVPSNKGYIIDTNEAKDILKDENSELVSIRSWEEYLGKTSGYTYIKPKGRIAGSVWGHAGSDPYHMEHYRNLDNTMRNYKEIEKFWKEWGITSDKNISFFCGTGWRASEAFFYSYLMGWENISVYDGGWYEWSMDESNPIDSGEPK